MVEVEKTVASARNSPKRSHNLTPKRLGTNSSEPRLTRVRLGSAQNSMLTNHKAAPSAAVPRTPDVMRRYRAKLAQGAAGLKAAVGLGDMKKKLASKSGPSLISGTRAAGPVKPPTLTRPKEFNFATSGRVKPPSPAPGHAQPQPADFGRSLRSYSATSKETSVTGPTKPAPFNLTGVGRKRRHSAEPGAAGAGQEERYRSQAELIQGFHRNTPDRFRSRPAGGNSVRSRHRSASPAAHTRLTVACTPQLATRGRSRAVDPTVLSREEREQQQLEENKQQQFKARAVGETLPRFKYGEVEKRPCTVPEPFQLATSARLGLNQLPGMQQQEEEEGSRLFTAKPAPRAALAGPVGVPERKQLPVVDPQSPAFVLKSRMAERKPRAEPEPEPEPVPRARPVPHRGVPVVIPPIKSTLPEPFSFAERDRMTQQKKEEKIKQLHEEEKKAREFHAKPILKEDVVKIPVAKPAAPTKVEPFKLQIEERVGERLTKWEENMKKELEEQKKAALFKASEPKVLHQEPFVPELPPKNPLLEVSNFKGLHSDRRAAEREQFDMKLKQREAEIDGLKRERAERKAREEEEEIARMRKAAVPKANPIRNYKFVDVKPSDRPLTQPESPNLQAGKRPNATYSKQ